ncbi:MAG TPA: DNA translocase FtsK 4TM domain-containing protein, partial [Candidatus Binatia bacterium]|nr:DNA translocase FtsK 4TM domain-containing protein [Candidatus Binatia bacterium]
MATRRPSALPGAQLVREAEAISAGAVAVFLAISFLSYAPDAPRANLGGPVGHALAGTALRALGVAAYLFPVYLAYFTVALLRRGADGFGGIRLAGAGLVVVGIAALAGLATGGEAVVRGGGWLGGFVAVALHDLIGGPGALLLLSVLLVVAFVLATGLSAIAIAGDAVRWARNSARAQLGAAVAR